MIITLKYAKKLIRDGKACDHGVVTDDGKKYMVITRYDLQRVDHAEVDLLTECHQ